LKGNGDLKRKWTWAVEWLGDELERRPYTGNPQYTYNNWSPPVQSNETSNGYFLERSHSARMTLAKACELCPEEVKKATSVQQIEMEECKVILYFIGQCLYMDDSVKGRKFLFV
jgi:ubiquitin carboxyl-terminal hydrolase 9/24